MAAVGSCIVLASGCQGPQDKGSGILARNQSFARRLIEYVEHVSTWHSFWGERATSTAHNSDEPVTVVVVETASKAAFCLLQTGFCGLVSWSSTGELHLIMSRNMPPNLDPRSAESIAASLAAPGSMMGGPRTGDLSATEAEDGALTLQNHFTAEVKYPRKQTYSDLCKRECVVDPTLAELSAGRVTAMRRGDCTDGKLVVPLVAPSDPWAYVLVDLGGSCGSSLLVWKRNSLGSWSLDKLVVRRSDVEVFRDRLQHVRTSEVPLP